MLHATLWQECADLANACRHHEFVRGLESGALPIAVFKRYVAQDAFFLRAFLRAYALVLAKCDDIEQARQLATFISGALDELRLHADFARQLGIDLRDVRPLAATRAYSDFLTSTAWHAPAGLTLAAMTPCMRLYAFLGQCLARAGTPDHPYGDWIRTYAAPEFENLARSVEAFLDALASDTPVTHDAYRYAMRCELDFFGAPLEEPA